MVRSESGTLSELFLENNIAAIGWHEVGDLSASTTRKSIAQRVKAEWPEISPVRIGLITGMLYRLRSEIERGDTVITYDSPARRYHVGSVESDYRYSVEFHQEYPNIRSVKWHGTIDRDDLSVQTKNELGATMTLFKLSQQASAEIDAVAKGMPVGESPDTDMEQELDEEELLRDIQSRSREFIKDRISKISWDHMQELVAGLLRSMGYKTRVSPPGSDLGRDILASPDGFGLEHPRIIVEVKHRDSRIGSEQIRSFLGGRHKDDKGLYVSTGGFTKDARYEADRASIPLTLMDLDELVTAIIDHYDNMDLDTRVLVPLVNVYWPA